MNSATNPSGSSFDHINFLRLLPTANDVAVIRIVLSFGIALVIYALAILQFFANIAQGHRLLRVSGFPKIHGRLCSFAYEGKRCRAENAKNEDIING